MIYRYNNKNIYYAGINYFNKVNGVHMPCFSHNRGDMFRYIEDNSFYRLIYKGVDISKDIGYRSLILSYDKNWQWQGKGLNWHTEEYPHDL